MRSTAPPVFLLSSPTPSRLTAPCASQVRWREGRHGAALKQRSDFGNLAPGRPTSEVPGARPRGRTTTCWVDDAPTCRPCSCRISWRLCSSCRNPSSCPSAHTTSIIVSFNARASGVIDRNLAPAFKIKRLAPNRLQCSSSTCMFRSTGARTNQYFELFGERDSMARKKDEEREERVREVVEGKTGMRHLSHCERKVQGSGMSWAKDCARE